jgi:hypothetical protein
MVPLDFDNLFAYTVQKNLLQPFRLLVNPVIDSMVASFSFDFHPDLG